ncbi:hypothetical protein NIE88_21570 [Sporolactobacillus shoreicorticis]|uniref:RNA polymerase sigma-70 region 4 domain-containing protein n=1 Tax=Sporolactobacillus shoreicorticis TaxID=1923877 RepID=A0ABW5S288_9BACL|nr:hypothetical protein [Sporolactobacillus shoreicorticis]MCO7128320.1 hypothetical protein [Sporolactobacillus shoreicorticis]
MADLLPITEYRDLCREIDLLDMRINQLEQERKYYWKMSTQHRGMIGAANYDEERVSHNFTLMPFDRAVEHIAKIDTKLNILNNVMADKEQVKAKMEQSMSEFEGLDYLVAYWRLQGLTLAEISDKLGYSYGWIKKISMRNGEKAIKNVRQKLYPKSVK